MNVSKPSDTTIIGAWNGKQRFQRAIERDEVRLVVGARGEGQVQVLAAARPLPDLGGTAKVVRILAIGVAVQRDVADVAAPPEDLLRPVSVMEVDVEDSDPLAGRPPDRIGSDRGVVEEAVAGVQRPGGVVAGRPAQAVGGGLAAEDEVNRRQRDVHGRPRSLVCPLDERSRAVEPVPARPSSDRLGRTQVRQRLRTHALEHVWVGPGIGDQRRALDPLVADAAPGRFEEPDKSLVVDRQNGVQAVPLGRHTLEAAVSLECLSDPLRAVRDLVGGDLLAEDRLVGDVVAQVDVRIDNPHRAILATATGFEGED